MITHKTYALYVGRSFFLWLSSALAGFGSIAGIFAYIELLRRAQNKAHIGFIELLTLTLMQLPDIVLKLSPFAILVASMGLLWRFVRHSEMVASRSVGMSLWATVIPMLVSAFVYGIFLVSVFNPIAAVFLDKSQHIDNRLFRGNRTQLTFSKTGLWLKQSNNEGYAMVRIGKVLTVGKTIQDISILQFDKRHHFLHRTDAERADIQSRGWQLFNGSFSSPQGGHIIDEWFWPTSITIERINRSFADPSTIPFWRLQEVIHRIEEAGLSSVEYTVYWYTLLSQPFLCISMVLMGALCAFSPLRRRGGKIYGLMGVSLAFCMYVLHAFSQALGLSMKMPPMLSAWLPITLAYFISLFLLMHYEER